MTIVSTLILNTVLNIGLMWFMLAFKAKTESLALGVLLFLNILSIVLYLIK